MKVYIAGPYTTGDNFINVANALAYADKVLSMGMQPFVPHLTAFWNMLYPHEYETWLEYDFHWVECCDAVLRIRGVSSGAEREIKFAKDMAIPVIYVEHNPEWRTELRALAAS